MAKKIKTITITAYGNPATPHTAFHAVEYQVERVTDSLDFLPGQYVDKKTVDDLCAAPDWKVTVVRPKG